MSKLNVEKSTTGFTLLWIMISVYSMVMMFFDIKLAILGFLIAVAFGFLGFDLVMRKLLDKEKA